MLNIFSKFSQSPQSLIKWIIADRNKLQSHATKGITNGLKRKINRILTSKFSVCGLKRGEKGLVWGSGFEGNEANRLNSTKNIFPQHISLLSFPPPIIIELEIQRKKRIILANGKIIGILSRLAVGAMWYKKVVFHLYVDVEYVVRLSFSTPWDQDRKILLMLRLSVGSAADFFVMNNKLEFIFPYERVLLWRKLSEASFSRFANKFNFPVIPILPRSLLLMMLFMFIFL